MKRMKAMLKNKWLIGAAAGLVVVALFVVLRGSKARSDAPAPPPPEVEVTRVEQRDVPIYSEWIGTLDGMVNAEIKAQVTGYLLRKDYTEGNFVKKGQLMFEIDPRPFQAALAQTQADLAKAQGQFSQANAQLAQAEAQLATAEANQGKTQLDENRLTGLAKTGVVAQQDSDNAVQANLAGKAQVKASQAGVRTARAGVDAAQSAIDAARALVASAQLNLGFTRITSPIDGIAGLAKAQIGDLINSNVPNSAPLTTVSTVDPIKVYFTMSEQEYLSFTRKAPSQAEWNATNQKLELEMVLSDGQVYPEKGKFFVADREVDQKTGAIRLAGIFPNPGNVLRPGQYGKVRAVTSTRSGALLVPQRAVSELQGGYRVVVLDSENRASIQPVKVGERTGSMWVIEDGLKPGDTVVVEGTQRLRPGSVVSPKPYTSLPAA
jgi:membrane fusion protein (multidrug efflux system)